MTTPDPDTDLVTLTVTINGTDENRWHRYGLRRNPFPQTAITELHHGERQLADLDGDPVTSETDIRARLAGFSAELIHLVIFQYRPGQRVSFKITFPRTRHTP
jgi:hypothetical protein